MIPLQIFEIRFPYLNNGEEYIAKVFSEKEPEEIRFRIYPINRVDFLNFIVTINQMGEWETESDYQKQTDFFTSICAALEPYSKKLARKALGD